MKTSQIEKILFEMNKNLASINTEITGINLHLEKLNDKVSKNSKFRIQGYLIVSIFGIMIAPLFIAFISGYF